MRNDFTREICNAIFDYKIPDDALSWDRIQVLGTTVAIGSGESTTWKGMITVRLNGKQIWRGTPYEFNYEKDKLLEDAVEVCKTGSSTIYVVKPIKQTEKSIP